ncbi:hypothetical protein ACPCXA_02765 [Lysinibacillus agricola]
MILSLGLAGCGETEKDTTQPVQADAEKNKEPKDATEYCKREART